jgi:hypothetical protein
MILKSSPFIFNTDLAVKVGIFDRKIVKVIILSFSPLSGYLKYNMG